MITASLLEKLVAIVGPKGLITGEEVQARPISWSDSTPSPAAAIVRPASTEEVSKVMQLCHQASCSVIPLGGATGLVGGVKPTANDIVLSLERMQKIESVDAVGNTISVEAGVVLQTLEETVNAHNLTMPLDLGARGSAMIGGIISTNAGGNRVIRYGMMREQVLGLEAVLADGTVISSMNRMIKNNAGYDLKQLFIGSEGTLGVITRAVLRLQPMSQSQSTAFIAANSFEQVTALLNKLKRTLNGRVSAFEVMWNDFYRTMMTSEQNHQKPLEDHYPFYILLETMGTDQTRDQEDLETALADAYEQGLYEDAVIAQTHSQRDAMWNIRDDIECLIKSLSPILAFDVSLPINEMLSYVDSVRLSLEVRWPETRIVVFGHLGDGNLHIVATIGQSTHEQRHEIEDIIYEPLRLFGGSISAEHGIGLEKRDHLSVSRSDNEIAMMRTLKQALDPKGILNPGKIFLT